VKKHIGLRIKKGKYAWKQVNATFLADAVKMGLGKSIRDCPPVFSTIYRSKAHADQIGKRCLA
jgi:hypothetical protein